MSHQLPLTSFEVEGFRAIRHLRLPELVRVNLFVGLNNAGKTSLLEAMRLYLEEPESRIASVYEFIYEHTGYRPRLFRPEYEQQSLFSDLDAPKSVQDEIGTIVYAVESLFHGSFAGRSLEPIRLGPTELVGNVLTLRVPWAERSQEEGSVTINPLFGADSPIVSLEDDTGTTAIPLESLLHRLPVTRFRYQRTITVPAAGFDQIRLWEMWDRVAVSGHEDLVELVMRLIVPELDRVLLVGESGRRSILVRIRGTSRPVPLRSMGDGANRIFGIALAMVLARDGVMLIDEVENGIHYSIQDEVWEAVFSISKRLNVQVMATTHSWDTIVGFQYAANQSEEEGMLYRLDRKPDGRVRPVRYTEKEVEIAATQRIEVR